MCLSIVAHYSLVKLSLVGVSSEVPVRSGRSGSGSGQKNEDNVTVKFRTGTTGTTGTTGIPLVSVPVPVVFDRNVNRGTTNQAPGF